MALKTEITSKLLVHHVTDIMSWQTEAEEKTRHERGMVRKVRSVLMHLHMPIKERMITAQWKYVEPVEQQVPKITFYSINVNRSAGSKRYTKSL